jgi:hypothetical protein
LSRKNLSQVFKNLEVSVAPYFSTTDLEELARRSKFVQRESKLNGQIFLELIIFNQTSLKFESLEDVAIRFACHRGSDITRQSVHERYNEYAVVFLKAALEKLLNQQLRCQVSLTQFKSFKRVLIKDSTCFQVAESLAADFPGSGGSGSSAAVRLQFEYDLLAGQITALKLGAFNEQDATDSLATIEQTQAGDLILRDLGYMNLKVLPKILAAGASFLCRPHPSVSSYELVPGKPQKLDFIKLFKYMKNNQLSVIEKSVYLGNPDHQFQVRLILYLLPAAAVAERLRKVQRQHHQKQRRGTRSQEFKARLAFNLFITNVSADALPTELIWVCYRLRWQIELIFKIWKSIIQIDQVKKVQRYRLECYIYAKLILIVLGWQILWPIVSTLLRYEKRPMSWFKAYKTLIMERMDEIQEIILRTPNHLPAFRADFYKISRGHHLAERRLQQLTDLEILLLCANN